MWEELGRGAKAAAPPLPRHPAGGEDTAGDAGDAGGAGDPGAAISRATPGLEPAGGSRQTFHMPVFTANPRLDAQLYNYNPLQLCKEVTLQKGLLISHSSR